MWAGTGSLAAAFTAVDIPLVAFCEHDALLASALSLQHPNAQVAGAFEAGEWRQWKMPKDLYIILGGGPSCASLSRAGRQEMQLSHHSSYIMATLQVAVHIQASMFFIENVPELMLLDHKHSLLSDLVAAAELHGYTLTNKAMLRDSDCGGYTQRLRFFAFFEVGTKMSVPALRLDSSHRVPKPMSLVLEDAVDPWDSWLFLPGDFTPMPIADSVMSCDNEARVIGSWNFYSEEPVTGSLVMLQPGWSSLGGQSDEAVWRVMSFNPDSTVRLLHSHRRKPRVLTVPLEAVNGRVPQSFPVYTCDGVGITLRRWGEPPLGHGFMVQRVSGQVSLFSPLEAWKLQGLAGSSAALLLELGASESLLREAAGNCITGHTAQSVACSVAKYVAAKTDSLQPDNGGLHEDQILVQILPVLLQSPAHFLLQGGRLISTTCQRGVGDSQHVAAQEARKLAASVFSKEIELFSVALQARNRYLFAVPVSTPIAADGTWLCKQDLPSEIMDAAQLTEHTLWSFMPRPTGGADLLHNTDEQKWKSSQRDLLEQVSLTGNSTVPLFIERKCAPQPPQPLKLGAVKEKSRLANQMLKLELASEARKFPEAKESLNGWADSIKEVPWEELPAQLHEELDQFDRASLASLEFPDPCQPPATNKLPRSIQPSPPSEFRPTRITDLITPEANQAIRSWTLDQLSFIRECETGSGKAVRKSNRVLALGQGAFRPEARGIVWDLRDIHNGSITPVDFAQPIATHLNLPLFEQELRDFPDQELLSFLIDGVRYKADLPLQIVLCPHLLSLESGYHSLLKEVDKYESCGWYGLFEFPPFLPFRLVPKGSVPRKLEPDRPRPTTDASAPWKVTLDSDKQLVISLNHGSLGKPPPNWPIEVELAADKWPHEDKPHVGHVMQAVAALSHAADFIKEPLLVATDDFKNFFNQLRLAPEEWWKCCMILSKLGEPQYAVEYIMTFGISTASNIAQRFANAIIHIFHKRMAAAEHDGLAQLSQTNTNLSAWLKRRGLLPNPHLQQQLFAVYIYTDDPIFLAVGPARMARLLRVWAQVTNDLRLLMAIPEKRQCGSHVQWIGAGILVSAGVAWIPAEKTNRALASLKHLLKRPRTDMTVANYHSLLGLLEHLLYLTGMRRNIMYGLWDPFKQGHAPEPAASIKVTPRMAQQAYRWRKLLSSCSAVSALRFVDRAVPAPTSVILTITSDAARSECFAGLGGWSHGLWWGLYLDQHMLHPQLTIPVLEFIASIVSIATFGALLDVKTMPAPILHVRADASATPRILARDAASSIVMQAVHQQALRCPAFSVMQQHVMVSHISGTANELADKASRCELESLHKLASQMGISPRRIDPSPLSSLLLAEAVRPLTSTELDLSVQCANTPDSASFVKLNSSQLRQYNCKPSVHTRASARTQPPSGMCAKPRRRHGPVIKPSASAGARLNPSYSARHPPSNFLHKVRSMAMLGASKESTNAVEAGHWRSWSQYCALCGVEPWRDDHRANSGKDASGFAEEVELLAGFLVWHHDKMRPKGKNAYGKRKQALPSSAANAVLSIRRIHRHQFPRIDMVPYAAVKGVLRGLNRKYKNDHGWKALLPSRKEPWRSSWLVSMFELESRDDVALAGFTAQDTLPWTCYFALLQTLAQTGLRKSEVATKTKQHFDPNHHITRSNLMWCVGGDVTATPTKAQLINLAEEDYAILIPPPSKADELGVIWGNKPIYLPVRASNPWCAALKLRDIELLMPLRAADRKLVPLFCSAPGAPFTFSVLTKMLNHVKKLILPPAMDPDCFSYHSFRIFLATALGAVRDADGNSITDQHIQAMCRWVAPESLLIYKRMQPSTCMQLLDMAAAATITSYETSNLPPIR